ncbi:MAG: YidC/Oxa1 family membrane protein insertase [Chloroflexota bacterium]
MWDSLIIDPLINTLLYIYSIFGHNFGLAIILLTVLIRIILYPLTAKQIKSSKSLQDLQESKKWQEIQKKYKNDREKLAQEQMKLYQEMGINPFGACLPTLIQLPIIIGLYQSIINALASTPIQLLDLSRHIYSFFPNISSLIPLNSHFLWMDLSQKERLFLPFLPNVGIPVLAILVVITSYMQSKLMTPPQSNPGDQGAQMSKMMNIYMPLLIGYLALSYASGLALYFLASNVVGILQYAIMGKLEWSNLLPFIKKEKKPK